MEVDKRELSDAELLEFEETYDNFLSRAWRGFKTALMGTLFVMAKDSTLSFCSNLIGMIIDFLQMLAFPFNYASEFPWNQSYSGWFAYICFISKLELYISADNPLQNLIIYVCSMLLVVLTLVNAGIVGYKFLKKKVQNVFLLKILRSVAGLVTTVLYMPFLSQFSIIFGCAIGTMVMDGCPTQQPALLAVSAALISAIFAMLSLIVAASFYEQDYTSDDVSARPHARVELLFLVVKGVVTVIFNVAPTIEYQNLHIFSIMALGVPITFMYIWYLPYYDYRTTVVQAQFLGVYTWCGICLLIAKLEGNIEDAGPITLFYLGSLPIWILTKAACDLRREHLYNMKIETIRDPYEVELHTRYYILSFCESYKETEENLLNEVEEFYYKAERKFGNSSLLKLFVAQFHLTYRNRNEAIAKLEQAEQRNPKLDEQFIIYKTRQNAGKDAITVVTFSSYLESAHKAEVTALNAQKEFWSELNLNSKQSFDKLVSLARIITKNIDTAETYYKYLMNLDRTHSKMLPMYVYFMEDLMHKSETTEIKNLRNRIQDLKSEDEGKNIKLDMLLHPEFTVSLSKANFGEIEKVNKDMMEWAQLPKAKLMNQHLNTLTPKPFGYFFINFLENLREVYDTRPVETVEVFIMDKENFVISGICNLRVEEYGGSKRITQLSDDGSQCSPESSDKEIEADLLKIPGGTNKRSCYLLPSITTPGRSSRRSSIVEGKKLRLICPVYITSHESGVIFLDSEFYITAVNRYATNLLGLSDVQTRIKIDNHIKNFQYLFTKSKNHAEYQGENLVFPPMQSFVIRQDIEVEFIRIKIHVRGFNWEKEMYYILYVERAPPFSKTTEKFFRKFVNLFQVYLTVGAIHGFETLRGLTLDKLSNRFKTSDKSIPVPENLSDNKGAQEIIKRVKKKVERHNSKFAPELKTLRKFFVVLLLVNIGVSIGSFFISGSSFEQYSNQLSYINKFTDIQTHSLSLALYARLLDAARQGCALPEDLDTIYNVLRSTLDTMDVLVRDVTENAKIDIMDEKSVKCVSIQQGGTYQIDYKNPVESLNMQYYYAQKVLGDDLSEWNIRDNPYVFWVYENGVSSIAESLENLSHVFISNAEDARSNLVQTAIYFCIWEMIVLILIFFISLFYLMKSEKIHLEVVKVFYSIPPFLTNFMNEITNLQLQTRQEKDYPNNRNKLNWEDIWEDHVLNRSEGSGSSENGKSVMLNYDKSWISKIFTVLGNSLMKKIIGFILIASVFVIVLQTWLGQVRPGESFENESRIMKYVGTLDSLMIKSDLYLMNTILADSEQVEGNYTFVSFDSMELSFDKAINETQYLRKYMRMFVRGDEELEIPYEDIYPLMKNDYFDYFFGKKDIFIGGEAVSQFGLYEIQKVYVFDLEYLVHSAYYMNNTLEGPEKWSSLGNDLLRNIKLDYRYLGDYMQVLEDDFMDYYKLAIDKYRFIREIVLVVYVLFCAFFYIVLFQKSLLKLEKKKQLTRSMLLLLPENVVAYSNDLQEALKKIKFH